MNSYAMYPVPGTAGDYLNDTPLPHAERLIKFAGQLCYLSLGSQRTLNADAEKYFENINASGHGSVLEHANFSFLFYGVSRSFTHELVRHRAGFGFSQVSQRYVNRPRFVERPEYVTDDEEHELWLQRCKLDLEDYETTAMRLQRKWADKLKGVTKTEARKRVNQVARESSPYPTVPRPPSWSRPTSERGGIFSTCAGPWRLKPKSGA